MSIGQTVESQYPPKEIIKLQVTHNLELEATPYKDSGIEGSIDKRDIKKSISLEKTAVNTIEINKMTHKNQYYPTLRNYYPRPTSADINLEERTQLNLDDLSKQPILDLMCTMTMAVIAYKAKRATDREAVVMITQGFTGQLKGW
ncbi:hypothetical protein AHAS_Ahas08G0079700 [Arachis hypogaea]